jgi:ribosome-associated toxin RatA of RatAB toxin-antitoxin module
MQNFVDVLKNVEEYEEWVPDLKYSKLLESNGAHQIHYIITELPFPLKDRDEIYKYTFLQKNSETVEVKMQALPDYLPLEKDLVRMPKSNGSYIFESMGPGQTKVSLQMHNDPGGNLPAWAVNSKIVKVPFGTLLALEKQASSK